MGVSKVQTKMERVVLVHLISILRDSIRVWTIFKKGYRDSLGKQHTQELMNLHDERFTH